MNEFWSINANGSLGQLDITGLDPGGNLTGTVYGDNILGFWDEASQKITFIRIINAADPSSLQIFTGYQFNDASGLGILAGSFEAFKGTGGTAQRVLYGWVANALLR